MNLLSDVRADQNPADALCRRRCVSSILRASVGNLLGEKAQIAAANQLCLVISKQKTAAGK